MILNFNVEINTILLKKPAELENLGYMYYVYYRHCKHWREVEDMEREREEQLLRPIKHLIIASIYRSLQYIYHTFSCTACVIYPYYYIVHFATFLELYAIN